MRAKKSFGQNFLIDERVVERIVNLVAPRADETLIEIGPGRGALTSRLLKDAGRLFAVEFDRDLVPLLRRQFGEQQNFTLVEADALQTDFCALIAPDAHARVVANLPYYISTAILQHLIAQRLCISEMLLMLQREVVERMTAKAGDRERGFLSVLVEAYCDAEALFDVAPASFRPVPKVWSTVIRLRLRDGLSGEVQDETLFWQLVSAGFAQKRKTILNNLRHAPANLQEKIEAMKGAIGLLERAEVGPQRRAETLSLKEWIAVFQALTSCD